MYKETINYVDYDGNERTEDFYFNLTTAECLELNVSKAGGLEKTVNAIIAEEDGARLVELFKSVIAKAYGKKSVDGRRFIKNDEVRNEFMETEAYSQLFMKLATDAEAAAAFVNGITPKEDNKIAGQMELPK